MKPTLDELIIKLEEKFGKLTPQANHCTEDIYSNYENFIESISSYEIIFVVSPNMLADKLQETKYTRYRTFGGLSILMVIIGIVTLFLNWKIAIGIFILAYILKKISSNLKFKSSQDFAKELTSKFLINPDEGMFDVCQYYIAGILQLASSKGRAHLPLLPSYSLSGIEIYARRE